MKILLKIILLFGFVFVIQSLLNAQPVTWQRILNNSYGELNKANQTYDSGYIAVGTDYIGSNTKIFLIKFNKFGDSLWTKLIGTNPTNHYDGNWGENTTDKGFIIAGSGEGPNTDAYLAKTDSLGNVQWNRSFGGGDLDQGYCVKQTLDKGFIMLIMTTSFNNYRNIMLVKTDSIGFVEWQKEYLTSNNQFGNEVIELSNGFGIIGTAYGNMYFIKTNSIGDTIWTKQYGGLNVDDGRSIQQTSDGGFILGGVERSFNSNNYENSYIVKTDSSGNVQWQRSYNVTYKEILYSVRSIPNNKYIFCGTTDSAFGKLEWDLLE